MPEAVITQWRCGTKLDRQFTHSRLRGCPGALVHSMLANQASLYVNILFIFQVKRTTHRAFPLVESGSCSTSKLEPGRLGSTRLVGVINLRLGGPEPGGQLEIC